MQYCANRNHYIIFLLYIRVHNRIATTYESGMTRSFLLGRTETIRSSTIEAKAFAEVAFSEDIEVKTDMQTYKIITRAME